MTPLAERLLRVRAVCVALGLALGLACSIHDEVQIRAWRAQCAYLRWHALRRTRPGR